MVDLDSNPPKLIESSKSAAAAYHACALTSFSIANDVSKYFAIIPAAFATPIRFKVAEHHAPGYAGERDHVAVIFNAIIIILLIPLALRGVKYRPSGPAVTEG